MEATYDASRLLDIHRLLLRIDEQIDVLTDAGVMPCTVRLLAAHSNAIQAVLELEHLDLTEPGGTVGRPVAERFADLFVAEVEKLFLGCGSGPIGGNDNLSLPRTADRLE